MSSGIKDDVPYTAIKARSRVSLETKRNQFQTPKIEPSPVVNKLLRVKNPWFSPIASFVFGFQSERSRQYVSSSLYPWVDNPQFSRSENKSVLK